MGKDRAKLTLSDMAPTSPPPKVPAEMPQPPAPLIPTDSETVNDVISIEQRLRDLKDVVKELSQTTASRTATTPSRGSGPGTRTIRSNVECGGF